MSDHLDSFGADLNQSQFFRMFALGCFDSFITLPITVTALVTSIIQLGPLFSFYQGWTIIHSGLEPSFIPKSAWSTIKLGVFSVHWDEWINPFLALVFFALFGLTPKARKGYCNLFRFLRIPIAVSQSNSTEEVLPDVVFKSGRGTNATTSSYISESSRYDLYILVACKHLIYQIT